MSALRAWWAGLSDREQRMLMLMLAMAGGVFLWLGIWRPIRAGIEAGRARYAIALDTNASVRAKLATLNAQPKPPKGGSSGPIDQIVAQSAAETGLTLDRSAAQGQGRIAITIGSARAGALLTWLSGLEARGITVETMSMTPGTTAGTVVVQAVLKGAG
jgi:general secretion pathway protein M